MAYPLLMIFVSGLAREEVWPAWTRRIVLGVLLAWLAASSLATWPDYLTYFSEAVGRRAGGLKISVVGEDWGQGVTDLADAQKKLDLHPLFYHPYVLVSPKAYGLDYEELNCDPPRPGYYALHLSQLKRPVANQALVQCVNYLKQYPPEFTIHGTIEVWKISTPGSSATPAP